MVTDKKEHTLEQLAAETFTEEQVKKIIGFADALQRKDSSGVFSVPEEPSDISKMSLNDIYDIASQYVDQTIRYYNQVFISPTDISDDINRFDISMGSGIKAKAFSDQYKHSLLATLRQTHPQNFFISEEQEFYSGARHLCFYVHTDNGNSLFSRMKRFLCIGFRKISPSEIPDGWLGFRKLALFEITDDGLRSVEAYDPLFLRICGNTLEKLHGNTSGLKITCHYLIPELLGFDNQKPL